MGFSAAMVVSGGEERLAFLSVTPKACAPALANPFESTVGEPKKINVGVSLELK